MTHNEAQPNNVIARSLFKQATWQSGALYQGFAIYHFLFAYAIAGWAFSISSSSTR